MSELRKTADGKRLGTRVVGRTSGRRRSSGGWLMLLASVALLGSCYNPDFSRVLYQCGAGGVCPDGLMCIDGKHCTYTTTACEAGGIMIAPDTFVCPGDFNACHTGYKQCPISVTTNLCHLDVSDLGKPEGCAICCSNSGDMAH